MLGHFCIARTNGLAYALPLVMAALWFAPSRVCGQRVQIPNTPGAFAPSSPTAPAWGAPALSGSSVYGTPGGVPGYGIPATPAPAFDPYAAAGSVPGSTYNAPLGAPPAGLPYSYTPPTTGAPAYGAPQYNAPAFGAPPLGASPYDVSPYAAPGSAPAISGPAYSPSAPPFQNGMGAEGAPLGWQPGTYGFQGADGSITRFRQFMARVRGEHTLLLGDNSIDSFEVNRTELTATFAFPFAGSIEAPLLLTPGFAFNWFNGPEGDPAAMPRGPDLPPLTYDAYLDLSWFPRFTPGLGAELGFRTGVWTDFNALNSDSLRFLGRGLGVVTITPQFELLLGAVYLDRIRIKMLPAGGVRWRPSPEWDLYLVFPNPKIRRVLRTGGSADWWWFAGAEYGGGSWTVERAGGLKDRIDYNDVRVSMGLEWQLASQARGHLEIGYAFDREVLFDDSRNPARFDADDAVMFRAGIGY